MREVSHEHDVASFACHRLSNPGRGVGWLEASCCGECGKRIAAAPERFGGLPGPELAAVPDDCGLDAPLGGLLSQQIDLDAAASGKRPRRIDIWPNGITVVNQVQQYLLLGHH